PSLQAHGRDRALVPRATPPFATDSRIARRALYRRNALSSCPARRRSRARQQSHLRPLPCALCLTRICKPDRRALLRLKPRLLLAVPHPQRQSPRHRVRTFRSRAWNKNLRLKKPHIMPDTGRTQTHVEIGKGDPEKTKPCPEQVAAIKTAHARVGAIARRRFGKLIQKTASQMSQRVTTKGIAAQ